MTRAAAALADPLLVARDILGVGVTGHRLERLGSERAKAIRPAIDAVLAAIEQAIERGRHPADLRLITGLADGADKIASEVALARGWPLDTILPFVRAEYARDFAEADELADYRRLLKASRSVFELTGERGPGGDGLAYERAGRVTLAQSDLLLAVWDGEAARGRGGTGQIVAEAVLLGLPVIVIDPDATDAPQLLWDGLIEHDLGQQSVETVARGALSALPLLVTALLARPDRPGDATAIEDFARPARYRGIRSFAYPLLQAVVGVRRLQLSDFRPPDVGEAKEQVSACTAAIRGKGTGFAQRLDRLAIRFAQADVEAGVTGRVFRSSYVANFMLAAFAVILSLSSLLVSAQIKPLLVVLEFITIASILLITRRGASRAWHQRWLDHRELAERLRCLALSAQLGDLGLRHDEGAGPDSNQPWFVWFVRGTAREVGLPSLRVDKAYLEQVRSGLRRLLDDQIAYLSANSRRMHLLEHRLHLVGSVLFTTTAVVCLAVLTIVGMERLAVDFLGEFRSGFIKAAIVISAALPAIGSAIYGIRMQGDFGGSSARDAGLAAQLTTLRHVVDQDELSFDTLKLRVSRATDLLTTELADWGQSYRARPLTLPG